MKYLIVGLGNPGAEYAHTRHNIGFDVLDFLAEQHNAVFEDSRYGWIAKFKIRGRQVICLKPATYMNLSGNAVRYWLNQEKVDLANLLVITDDLNLETGVLRMRGKGSHGGHNGLRHINEVLMTEQYARLRFGVGDQFEKGKQVNYVLGKWGEENKTVIDESTKKASEAAQVFVTEGINKSMNVYNG
jgi:peptidyl-tRNA hydrolase, PTH1 family